MALSRKCRFHDPGDIAPGHSFNGLVAGVAEEAWPVSSTDSLSSDCEVAASLRQIIVSAPLNHPASGTAEAVDDFVTDIRVEELRPKRVAAQ